MIIWKDNVLSTIHNSHPDYLGVIQDCVPYHIRNTWHPLISRWQYGLLSANLLLLVQEPSADQLWSFVTVPEYCCQVWLRFGHQLQSFTSDIMLPSTNSSWWQHHKHCPGIIIIFIIINSCYMTTSGKPEWMHHKQQWQNYCQTCNAYCHHT